jgi:hypothetical protein
MREKAAALQGDGITRAEKQQYIITLPWSFGSMGAGWFCSWVMEHRPVSQMSCIKYEESATNLIIIQQFTFPPKLLPSFWYYRGQYSRASRAMTSSSVDGSLRCQSLTERGIVACPDNCARLCD